MFNPSAQVWSWFGWKNVALVAQWIPAPTNQTSNWLSGLDGGYLIHFIKTLIGCAFLLPSLTLLSAGVISLKWCRTSNAAVFSLSTLRTSFICCFLQKFTLAGVWMNELAAAERNSVSFLSTPPQKERKEWCRWLKYFRRITPAALKKEIDLIAWFRQTWFNPAFNFTSTKWMKPDSIKQLKPELRTSNQSIFFLLLGWRQAIFSQTSFFFCAVFFQSSFNPLEKRKWKKD